MSKPEDVASNLMMADINPSKLLEGVTPRLIDEWQIALKLWDAVRYEVDNREKYGHFILTGSAVPPKTNEIFHTGTGRFAWIKMRTMSLYESGESTGEFSLKELFNQSEHIDAANKLSMDNLAFLICRGGWPEAVNMDADVALDQAFDCCSSTVNSDISSVDGEKGMQREQKRLMRSYAGIQESQTAYSVMRVDISANDSEQISDDTVYAYTNALRKFS